VIQTGHNPTTGQKVTACVVLLSALARLHSESLDVHVIDGKNSKHHGEVVTNGITFIKCSTKINPLLATHIYLVLNSITI
jgi:hypothetical protein